MLWCLPLHICHICIKYHCHVSLITKCVTGDFLQLTFNDVGRGGGGGVKKCFLKVDFHVHTNPSYSLPCRLHFRTTYTMYVAYVMCMPFPQRPAFTMYLVTEKMAPNSNPGKANSQQCKMYFSWRLNDPLYAVNPGKSNKLV
jgi:hypothetical protein